MKEGTSNCSEDQSLLQLAALQEEAQQCATSLNNLQMVLEQFQQGKKKGTGCP